MAKGRLKIKHGTLLVRLSISERERFIRKNIKIKINMI